MTNQEQNPDVKEEAVCAHNFVLEGRFWLNSSYERRCLSCDALVVITPAIDHHAAATLTQVRAALERTHLTLDDMNADDFAVGDRRTCHFCNAIGYNAYEGIPHLTACVIRLLRDALALIDAQVNKEGA